MKLNIVQVGNSDKNQELNIKNPHAAVANLRAAISITLRVESRSFVMSYKGQDLNDETQKLGAGGLELADGDTVTISVRRPRDSTNSVSADAAPSASSTTTTATGAAAVATATDNTTSGAPPAPAAKPSGKKTKKSKKNSNKKQDDVEQETPLDDVSAARSIRHVAAQASANLTNREKIPDSTSEDDEEEDDVIDFDDEEDEEWFTDDDDFGEEDEEDEFDEEAEQEAQEVSRMFDILSSLPNQAEMRSRFQADPEGTLRGLQSENPELFQLINKHPQAFLAMANEDNDDFDDAGEWVGGEDDEMGPQDAALLQFLMNAGAHHGDGDDSDDADGSDHEEDFLLNEDEAAQLMAQQEEARRINRRSRRRRNQEQQQQPAGEDAAAAEGNNTTSSGTTTTTRRRARRAQPRNARGPTQGNIDASAPLTAEDNEKIMRIVELGFSQEQATQAYLRFGRNPDRAAAWLFENQS